MRVITGSARGRRLTTLEGESVRPTPERVKEAVFSAVQFDIEGRRVLDLFAGSGQIGIEALSRGAKQAVFVDESKDSIEVIKSNLENTGLSDKAQIKNMDFAVYLMQNREKFAVAFLDPPYRKGILQRALPLTASAMNKGGTIICENPVDEEIPECMENFIKIRNYRYGKIQITLYRHTDVTEK